MKSSGYIGGNSLPKRKGGNLLRAMSLPASKRANGFSLVVTMMMMAMIMILALGMFSLSTVSLRTVDREHASKIAEANARLALSIALARLQEEAGDDRRITADASILASSAQPNLVGVWESWSPNYSSSPSRSAPNYKQEKSSRFKSWLMSGPDDAARDEKWAATQPMAMPSLFSKKRRMASI